MRKQIILLLLSFFIVISIKTSAQLQTHEFSNPPTIYKPIPLWFWNNTTVEKEELENQFYQMVHQDGYGGCAILPFGPDFKPEYLSEEYFQLYGQVIEQAHNMGVTMSLYDEYGFPSGSIGAINADGIPRFMNKYPDATIKRLDKHVYQAEQGKKFNISLPEGDCMAIVGMHTKTKERISLKSKIKNNTIQWETLSPDWEVWIFLCVKDGDPNVDYLDPEAVKLFVKETHEEYYKRFPEAFGTVITTTFFDEPTMYRAEGRMWTPQFNEKFIRKYGFEPDLLYPALWTDIGEETYSARNYLFGFRSQLYAEGFMKTIQKWAAAHNILSTGHQDQEEVVNPVSVAGDLMLCGKYMDIPGIDKIGGKRPAELYYKVISSSAYNWDKNLIMAETYGAMGNISVTELYQIAMEQYAKGINYLIPHAVWYNDKRVTFLPELSYRNELYNKDLPEFNQFLTRLNYFLRPEGRHIADIAMIYPIESLQGEHYLDGKEGFYKGGVIIPNTDYIHVSSLLNDSLGKDFTYLHPEVINEKCYITGNELHLDNPINKEKFRVLIVPGMKTISLKNLKKIESFSEAGGYVIFTTQLPAHSVELGKDKEVRKIVEKMLKARTGNTSFIEKPSISSLRNKLNSFSITYDVSFPENQELLYIHKSVQAQSVYYLANIHEKEYAAEVTIRGHIKPLGFNPHTGLTDKISYQHKERNGTPVTILSVKIKPVSSLFIIEEK